MDEFDALVRGGKQTVLYTLVDAMRHTQAQVCAHQVHRKRYDDERDYDDEEG